MLPPPTTAATCTPSFTAAMISVARWATMSREQPAGQLQHHPAPARMEHPCWSGFRHQALSGGLPGSCLAWFRTWPGFGPGLVSGLAWYRAWPGSGLTDLEPGEASDGDAVLR